MNPVSFCNNLNFLLKHNSNCLCRDCISECEICGEFIVNCESEYCYDCNKMIKKELLINSSNDLTNTLPIELVYMILKCL